MEKVNFKAGCIIFDQGETANQLFIISSGKVGLYFPTNELMEEPNIVLNSPEIFGEMGLIDDALRMAGAKAETDCILISVPRVEFEQKLENSDVIIRGIIATLSQRLRQLQKKTLE